MVGGWAQAERDRERDGSGLEKRRDPLCEPSNTQYILVRDFAAFAMTYGSGTGKIPDFCID